MSLDLAYTEHGSGPPVVILHGLLGSARNWTSIAERLAGTHRVLAVDLRNHGSSPWADAMSYEAMAEDVAALVARLGLASPAVVGHSMGGKVAMQLALRHGDAVARLAVVDIAPVRYERSFAPYIEAMRQADLSVDRRSEVDVSLKPAVPDAGVRAFLLQNLVSSDGGFAWRVNLPALLANMDAIMGFPPSPDPRNFEGPALFLAGGRSDYLRPVHREGIERLFPRAEFEVIEDAGHWVQAERPAAFLEVLERFLKGAG
jgi:pimeloyl-ACP methyl ester carboxylesterase